MKFKIACFLSASVVLGDSKVTTAPPLPDTPVTYLIKTGMKLHLPVSVIEYALSVANHESGMNPRAYHTNKNGTHDSGVMQLNDRTVRKFHVKDPFDFRENISVGMQIIADYYVRYSGDLHLVNCAYALGPAHCR